MMPEGHDKAAHRSLQRSTTGRPPGLSSFHIPLNPPHPDQPVFYRRHERRSRSEADRRRCEITTMTVKPAPMIEGALNAPPLVLTLGFTSLV